MLWRTVSLPGGGCRHSWKEGYCIHAVSNGCKAVDELRMARYDLVLMDCQMPEMDGYEATRAIRDPGSGVLDHDVPVIAMTANTMKGDSEKCLAAGMNDYISKPVKPDALYSIVQEMAEACLVRLIMPLKKEVMNQCLKIIRIMKNIYLMLKTLYLTYSLFLGLWGMMISPEILQ